MPPELVLGNREEVGVQTDVYILGGTLFHILTGRAPWQVDGGIADLLQRITQSEAPRARDVDPTVPPGLDTICARAMARRIDERYASVAALAADVERWLAGTS
jgi:serine/threonine protein kinase